MEASGDVTGLLNDLTRINRERIAGYQKAIGELKDTDIDLKTLFTNLANASSQNVNALVAEVQRLGREVARDTTQSGKLYRVWMDFRSGISAHDRRSILALCEFGEDSTLKAYKLALEANPEMPAEIRKLLAEQKSALQHAHDTVKRYRDMSEVKS